MRADFLNLRLLLLYTGDQRTNLVFLLRDCFTELLLSLRNDNFLYRDPGIERSDLRLLFLNLFVLLEKLIQQHRVDLLIPYGLDLAFLIVTDQIRVHLLDVFRDEPEHWRAFGIKLFFVAKADRLEREEHFTRLIHRFDLFLESARGSECPDLIVGIDVDHAAIGHRRVNVANTGRVTLARNAKDARADTNIAVASSQAEAGITAQSRVAVAGRVTESERSNGRVRGAGGVKKERLNTGGRVAVAGGV